MANIPSAHAFTQASYQQLSGNEDFVIINGRRVACSTGISGQELINQTGHSRGRRVVKVSGGYVQKIDPRHHYAPHELKDKNGRPVKIKTMPERTKGNILQFLGLSQSQRPASAPQSIFEGHRTAISRQLITEQVIDIARNYFKSPVSFDEEGANWVVFPHFRLPRGWSQPTTPLLINFPRDYPTLPPIGFYLPNTLPSPHGHKFNQAYHNASSAPLLRDWDWYCCYVAQGGWQPAPLNARNGWRDGDNLWTYLTLINEVLASND